MNTPKKNVEESLKKGNNYYRTNSDDLSDVLSMGLKEGNVLIIDGLKYRLHGNKLIIDKNAAKSADIQGKHYEPVIELFGYSLLKGKPYAPYNKDGKDLLNSMDRSEITRRIELADKLAEYGIDSKSINFHAFENHFPKITWTEELQRKMDLLKGKPYAPNYAHNVILINNLDESEVTRRIQLADKLAEYGIDSEDINFDAFERHLSEITWTEELQRKMDLLKGKPYAPGYAHNVILINNLDESEITRRIELADKLAEYGIKPENINFDAFEKQLSQITWTDELKGKMDLLKGKRYAPAYAHNVVLINNMDESEMTKRINLANRLNLLEITWTEDLQKKFELLEGKPYDISGSGHVKLLDEIGESEITRRMKLVDKLAEYGIENINFDDFKWNLSKITWTENLQKKMDLLKGKPYAPSCLAHVVSLTNVYESEITRRIQLVDKLAEYGINTISWDSFNWNLSEITWTENLQKKMDLFKGKRYAPAFTFQVISVDNMYESEIIRKINLADKLREDGKEPLNFSDFKDKIK